ncbi:MAG: ABC transporter permease [Desulfurococcales archaeon]|nr:ABC transporter permease [Desulfurococcales archaeon]
MPSARSTYIVAWYEAMRGLKKKTTILAIALVVIPLIAAVIARRYVDVSAMEHPERLWAVMAGLDESSGVPLALGGISGLTIVGLWWLIVILYSGDLYSSDARDGGWKLLLSRPIHRSDYILGKLASLIVELAVLAFLGVMSIIAAAWIIAGRQELIGYAVIVSLAMTFSGLPLALLTALIGMKFRSPLAGFIGGLTVYLLASVISGILAVYLTITGTGGNLLSSGYIAALATGVNPKVLAQAVYLRLAYGSVYNPFGAPMNITAEVMGHTITVSGTVNVSHILHLGLLTVTAWTALYAALTLLYFERIDM